MPKVTVLIPCKNEHAHIRECVESVRAIADEILVADSGSTDGTLKIVRSLANVRLIEHPWIGYAAFKNWAIPQARHEWVLIVDADERVTPELAAEIREVLATQPAHDAYHMRRRNFFLGREIHYSGWATTTITRLFRRDKCRYLPRLVHEDLDIPRQLVGRLEEKLLHYTACDWEQFVAKQVRYSMLAGDQRLESGARPNYLRMLFYAPWRFLLLYVFRGGILDGFAGLVLCMLMAFYAFLKDARVWAEYRDMSEEKAAASGLLPAGISLASSRKRHPVPTMNASTRDAA